MTIGLIRLFFEAAVLSLIVALFLHTFGLLQLFFKAAKHADRRALPVAVSGQIFVASFGDTLDKVIELINTYTSPFRVWLGHRWLFAVSDPEQIKTVLDNQYTIEMDNLHKFSRPSLETGVLTAPATKLGIVRELIAPAFDTRVLESFVETFARHSRVMTRQMRKELKAGEFDIHRYLALLFLDITCETVMGVKINPQEKCSRYADAVASTSETMSERFFQIWQHSDLILDQTKLGTAQREYLMYLHGVTRDLVVVKKIFCKNNTRLVNESKRERTATRKAFLDFMMKLSDNDTKLTDDEFREVVDTMIFTSFHTNAALSTFVTVMVANNPEIQARVYRELCDIYGDQVSSEITIKYEDLNRMVYLERVIKEVLRLCPVLPLILRETTKDLDTGEYTLPKGATICIGIQKMHRSEKYWPDPLKFDPDRFLPEEVTKRNPYCYLPFGDGPRNCIGQKYAMMATKIIIATVLRYYVLKSRTILDANDVKLKANILQPTQAAKIRISERVKENVKKIM